MTNAYDYVDSVLIYIDGYDRALTSSGLVNLSADDYSGWYSVYSSMSDTERTCIAPVVVNAGNSLIFINSVKKYTISLALRLSVDAESVVVWGRVMAMACVAVLPLVLLFFAAQKYFVEGIATSGLKG